VDVAINYVGRSDGAEEERDAIEHGGARRGVRSPAPPRVTGEPGACTPGPRAGDQ
jgi:hypothetical protein